METQKPFDLKIIDKRIPGEQSAPVPDVADPNAVIMMAIQKNYSPEFIEKMMDLAERNQKNVARQAFFDAIASFKLEAPVVKKDKYNNFFKSWYTSLGNLLDTYNPVLGKHGLSISFPAPEQTDTSMSVEGRLSHRMGHVESIKMTAPIDKAAIGRQSGERSRNAIQDIRSTFTYLRSMICEALLGVAGTEGTQDDDGNGAGKSVEYISIDQQTEINDLIKETKTDKPKFLKFIGSESVEKITTGNYKKALAALNAKKEKVK